MATTASARVGVWLALLVLPFAAAVAAYGAAPPRVGTPAPQFSLPLVANGQGSVNLASLRGHAVYLNFFASWCQPCKAEVPYISQLAQQFSKRHVVVIGIDELESADRAKQFASRFKLGYRIVSDANGDVGGAYGLIGLPLHVFISPDGTVAVYREGEMSEPQVRSALAQASSH